MMANQLLIAVIGAFFLVTGLMYVFQLRTKSDAEKREKTVSWVLVSIGIIMMVFPLTTFIDLSASPSESTNSSELLGEDAFGGAVPKITGDYNDSRIVYEKAVSLWRPELNGFDSTDKAMSYLNESLEIYETAEALTARGQLKVQLAQMTEALPDYSRAIELSPDFGNAYFNRAGLYYILGDTEGACADWEKAVEFEVPNAAEVYASYCN